MLSRPTVFALLGLVPLVNGCAAGDLAEGRPLRPNFITSGFVDQSATYGNVGAFIIQRASDGHIFPICSGTLIAPTVFLTVAHCTALYESEFVPRGFTAAVSFDSPIAFGDLTNLPGTSLIPAAQVVTNPGFTRAQDDSGDLGVLLLPPNRTQGITPAVLPTLGLLDRLAALGGLRNAVFTAVGYGVQDRVVGGGVPFFQDLNPIPRMFAFGSFIALNPGYLRLSQNPTRGSGGTCFGDSGGPNFLDLNGTRVLVATTVTGDAVCRATNVDYRLDIASARAFLGRFVTLP